MKCLNTLRFLSLLLIALQSIIADEPPKRKASEDQKFIIFAQVNETVTLKCPVESSPDFTIFVEWIKGNISLYNEQGYEITPKGFLKIKSAADKHSGIYTCEAVNGYGSVRVNLTLLVVDQELETSNYASSSAYRNAANRIHSSPPSIIRRPSSITADIGSEANFHCIASGLPVPRIFWLKDGQLIQGSNSYISKRKIHSTLKIKGLKMSDAGDYTCIARNVRGEDEMEYKLRVTDTSPAPKIISLDPPNVTIKKGATVAFVCEVDNSRPEVHKVHIKWLKKLEFVHEYELNDVNLFRSGDQYFRPLNSTDDQLILDGNVYISKMFIRNSCEEDAGTYVCLALNDKGFNFRDTSLRVIGAPEKLVNQKLQQPNGIYIAIIIGGSIIGVVVLYGIVKVASVLCHRNKSKEDKKLNGISIQNVESGSLKQSMTSVRKPSKKDNIPYPEIGDSPSNSKLLSIDSSFLCDHSETQISKSTHTKTPFH